MKLNKLYRKIDKYDVISFDIFDTLIIRAVNNPKQIFDAVGNNFNEFFHKKITSFADLTVLQLEIILSSDAAGCDSCTARFSFRPGDNSLFIRHLTHMCLLCFKLLNCNDLSITQ